jgi:hypothetical protein
VKKLVVLGAGGAFVAVSAALLSAGAATSDPGSGSSVDVTGQTYAQAVKVLRTQGVRAGFGGSVGSELPQAQCLVSNEKKLTSGKVMLMLDCTQAAKDQLAASGSGAAGGPPGPPTVGSNGVTTVTPTPVGPQPGMNVPGT